MKTLLNRPLLLVLAVSVSLISCKFGKNSDEPRVSRGGIAVGGMIRVASPRLDMSLNPRKMNNAELSFIGSQVHGTLVKADPSNTNPAPCLAERWELDESGTIWLFHLREDMVFQSTGCLSSRSEPITARNVANSLAALCTNDVEGAFFQSFREHIQGASEFAEGNEDHVSGIEPLDDYTLKITLNKPNPAFLYLLTEPACAVVYPCESGNSIASGAFNPRFNEGELTLTRNPFYPVHDEFGNSLPYLDEVAFKYYPNKEAEINAFFNGELDVVTNVYPDPIGKILEEHISDFSGKDAKYVIQRNSELASYDLYTLIRKEIQGFSLDYQGRPDLSRVSLKN